MLDHSLLNFGYAGLFAVCFAAATFLPLGSEAAVALMAAAGYNHLAVLLVATSGNVLGSLVNYAVGKWGRRFVFSSRVRVDPGRLARAEAVFGNWGAPIPKQSWPRRWKKHWNANVLRRPVCVNCCGAELNRRRLYRHSYLPIHTWQRFRSRRPTCSSSTNCSSGMGFLASLWAIDHQQWINLCN